MNAIPYKLNVQDFGEICHRILDAVERGETKVPTGLAVQLVGHVEGMLKEADRDNAKLLTFIGWYGSVEGAHHKQWVIDQIVRELSPGASYARFRGQNPEWDEGIAP